MPPAQFQGLQSHQVWTDASGSFGFDTVHPSVKQWIQLQWPESYCRGEMPLQEESVTLKELLSMVLACAVSGCQWCCSVVTVFCDKHRGGCSRKCRV